MQIGGDNLNTATEKQYTSVQSLPLKYGPALIQPCSVQTSEEEPGSLHLFDYNTTTFLPYCQNTSVYNISP